MAHYSHNLSPSGFLALIWAGAGLATFFVICRTWIRLRILDRFGWPDFWIFFAFCTLLASIIILTYTTPLLYVHHNTDPNTETSQQVRVLRDLPRYFLVVTLLFLNTLWTVKASFLAIFRPLFEGMQTMKRRWMGVAIFTDLSFISCLITPLIISAMQSNGSFEQEPKYINL